MKRRKLDEGENVLYGVETSAKVKNENESFSLLSSARDKHLTLAQPANFTVPGRIKQ